MVAAATIGAAAVSAVATGAMSSSASGAQTDAANSANSVATAQQAQTRADLMPYNAAGQAAVHRLTELTGSGDDVADPLGINAPLTRPITMDQATLEATPGYQFNLTQGLKAVQNSAAARGLGVSGAAMKGAATYATGLADSTYQNQFNNAVTNQTNAYNKLMGIATLGEGAGAQTGAFGTQTASNIGNNLVGAGNASAAASMATGNAISSGANNAGQAVLLNSLLGGKSGIYGGTSGTYSGNFNSSGP